MIIVLLMLLLLAPSVQAQPDAMQFELAIIRYADSLYEIRRRQTDEERNGDDQALEEAALDLQYSNDQDIFQIKPAALLADEVRKLRNAESFEVLYHGGWQQPLTPPGQARWIRFLGEPQNGLLAGNAQISFDKHFLLKLSILYDVNYHLDVIEQNVAKSRTTTIQFEETVQNGKIYYFDHPAIGVLILAREIKTKI